MKKILMALCAILTGCADYIPERPLPAARDLPEGSGITISISSDTPNEGVDRYMEITFRTTRGGDARAVCVVRQAGRREYLRDSAGEILIDSNDVELKALR